MKWLSLVVLAFFFSSGSAILHNRTCPTNVPLKAQFNPDLFIGTWFVDSGYLTGYDDFECFTVTFTQHIEGFRIFTQAMNFQTGVFWSASVRASLIDPPEAPQRPIFGIDIQNPAGEPVTFQVVATDYLTYALLWGCENTSREGEEASFEHFMLMTRETDYDLDPITSARVQDLIDRHVVRSEIRAIRQDKPACLGWPSPYKKLQ